MSSPDPGLRIRREEASSTHTLRLSGELDLTSAGQLETSIAECCADGARRVVLEMAELRFMDSTGLRSLLISQELCAVNDCAFAIQSLTPQVARLLELSGMDGRLRGEDA
ncbi:MAG: STAS domain-containing protein [Solirubrobacteraceae bacterium]